MLEYNTIPKIFGPNFTVEYAKVLMKENVDLCKFYDEFDITNFVIIYKLLYNKEQADEYYFQETREIISGIINRFETELLLSEIIGSSSLSIDTDK